MRMLAFLKKTFWENLRDWKILILALVFAPCFVFMMYGYFGVSAPVYALLVADHDQGSAASQGLIDAWREARHADGKPVFALSAIDDVAAAQARIRSRDADLLVEIPSGFGQALDDFRAQRSAAPARLTNHGDAANVRSSMALALSDYTAFGFAAQRTQVPTPLDVVLNDVGGARQLSEFDLYVPALLVLAIIMVLFTAAASLVKEVDKGTMTRLMLSRLTTFEFLAAISINQLLIGVGALALAYLAALACGYHSDGSLLAVLVVGAVSTLGVVALALLTAGWLRTMFELLTIGTFPFFILMFFSECMFPLPKVTLFHVASHAVYLNDVLPTALCVRALGQVLNFGAGIADVAFELGLMALLTLVYFVLGALLFKRRHLYR
jgi:ABC-2 type transport system permease protein